MAVPTVQTMFFDLGDTLVTTPRRWLPGAQQLLSTLAACGQRLGVIANIAALSRAQVLAMLPDDFDFGVFQADLVILSSEVQLEKPALPIFHLAIQRAGTPAAQCLFCTESLPDMLAAQQAGMRVARVQKPPHNDIAELFEALRRVGMLA